MRTDAGTPVVLVCMPWQQAARPPISLGILRGVLAAAGVPAAVRSFHLAFADHMARGAPGVDPLELEDYEWIAGQTPRRGLGDWAFAVEPYRDTRATADDDYLGLLADALSAEQLVKLRRVRALVPAFLEACVADVLAHRPRVVGFTSTFGQNVPSLVLARMLRQRDPELLIVFGGANCEGPMGAALHRSFPWIDYVVRGEGERVFPRLVQQLLAGEPPGEQPGLCLRRGGQLIHCPETASTVPMDEVPLPDYDEYFERLDASPLAARLRARLQVPYESARGCWWGAKHHCTFCGLNGASMRFRSKSPARVVGEIRELARRHQVLDFFVVDNIIDMDYFGNVLPELARSGWNLRLFFETKANLRLDQIRDLRRAGVTRIQPGIESLSTPILKLMRKGVTALQNIRLLKWCAAYRIAVEWNILWGFPGEPEEEYERMARLIPSLAHLAPPDSGQIRIHRFSPYFESGEALGMRISGPLRHYRHLYDVDPETLFDLAYYFDGQPADGRDPARYAGPMVDAIARWGDQAPTAYRTLTYRRGPGFIIVDDQRPDLEPQRYKFGAAEADIYLACDAGAAVPAIHRRLGAEHDLSESDIGDFLDELVDCSLVYREGDRYLSLAIAEDPDALLARDHDRAGEPADRPALVVLS